MTTKILFTLLIVTQISIAQNYQILRLTNYADDRKSAFSFTFDDGLKSQFDYAKPVLDQYGFKGTFYVLPPYLAENDQELIWRYGIWSEFQSMADEGHEIGSHTMNHDTLTDLSWGDVSTEGTLLYELYQSKIFIEQKIPSEKCISFNYPYAIHNSVVDSATKLFYENGRSLGENPNNPDLTGNQWYGLKAEGVEFSLPRDSVEDDLDELYSFIEWTQSSIDNNKWGMIIIHDVVPFNQLQELLDENIYEPITEEWLTWLCDFLWQRSINKDVWIETVGNITRYIKERENSTYQIISSSDQLIEINLSDNLNNEIYNYPLSAYISIPDSWNYVQTEQNDKVDTLTTTLTDSGRIVLVNIIPDYGNLRIAPIRTTVVENEISNINEFQLYQNYPNPFNPSTTISWQSPVGNHQTIKLFDVLGKEIETIVDGYYEAGFHSTLYILHSKLPSGVYFYQLRAGDFIQTKKMIIIR